MALHPIAPGVYKDDFGEFHVNESELGGAPFGEDGFDGDDDISGIAEADDAFGDDDAAAMQYLAGEIGRARNPRKRKKIKNRFQRRGERLERQAARKGIDLDVDTGGKEQSNMVSTAISGEVTAGAAGIETIEIRLQHDFMATDLRANGLAGSKVREVRFGDRTVWSSSTGVDISFLGAGSFLTGIIKNNRCKAGLDISISVEFPGAGDVTVVLPGMKPATC